MEGEFSPPLKRGQEGKRGDEAKGGAKFKWGNQLTLDMWTRRNSLRKFGGKGRVRGGLDESEIG